MMKLKVIAGLATAGLLAALVFAQGSQQKKSYVFRGKVEAVSEKNLTVANEKVEGWMDAMTMVYEVDDPAILKKVKPGDQIKATVYDDDYKLYKIEILPRGGGAKSKK